MPSAQTPEKRDESASDTIPSELNDSKKTKQRMQTDSQAKNSRPIQTNNDPLKHSRFQKRKRERKLGIHLLRRIKCPKQ